MISTEILTEGLPFREAIDFFTQKVRLPSRTWTDIWEGAHSRAFVVAGAMCDGILADFQSAILKGLEKGTTIQEFRKDFDEIVKRHGWSYRGGRGWRTATIYNTNLRTAYQAGHYKQMSDPDVLAARPYWRYSAVMDGRTRPQHANWHGVVLAFDDPWWKTHYPPNGWGCRCAVVNHSGREIERMKADGEKLKLDAPDMDWEERRIKLSDGSAQTVRVPAGIDPGWAYNVGETAWGRQLSEETMDAWRRQGAAAWERLTPGDWQSYGRPQPIPLDAPIAKQIASITTAEDAESYLKGVLGGDDAVLRAGADGSLLPVLVNAKSLASHIPANRYHYLPFLREVIEDPYEVWIGFERHRGTGKVELRSRFVKAVDLKGGRGLIMSAQAVSGRLEAWTFIPTTDWNYLGRQRQGRLLIGR